MVVPIDEERSIFTMLVGALIAGYGDLEFHLWGYILIFINCIFTAWYLIAIKKAQSLNLNVFGQILYTNLFGAPLFLMMCLTTEFDGIIQFKYWSDPGFMVRGELSVIFWKFPSCILTNFGLVLLSHVLYSCFSTQLDDIFVFYYQFPIDNIHHRSN